MPKSHPLNQILYGPPGTGKTYETARAAVEICDGTISSEEREEIMERYYELAGEGRIDFITFHQSIAYEDFIEGLRPTPFEDGKPGFELKSQSGVFRRIVTAALGESEDTSDEGEGIFSLGDSRVFKVSLGEYKDETPDQNIFKDAINDGYIIIGYNAGSLEDSKFKSRQEILKHVLESGVVEGEKVTTSSGWVSIPNIFRNQMRVGDFVIISAGNGKFRAVGQITGEYYYEPIEGNQKYAHRRRVKWLWSTSNPTEDHDVTKIYKNKFSQATVYELKNNLIDKEYLNKVIGGTSLNNPEGNKKNFVLIIDEINRANISKVFGELITLLEDDKRLGKLNALEVTLPYSGDKFGVPDNLYIIGTMNTADRSIALLDTALRRRFEFKELMPDSEKLKEIEGINLPNILTTLNDRIEYLLDREHQIGHAFFINCENKADLDAVMRNKVIPLLAEYFYDDWASMAVVLGDADLQKNKGGEGKFLKCEKLTPPPGCETGGNEDRYRWSVRNKFKDRVYQDFLNNTGNTPKEDELDEQAGP